MGPIHRGRLGYFTAASFLLIGMAAAESFAQIQIQVNPRRPRGLSGGAGAEEAGLTPPQDRDAESWLKRAAEAAEREDWKLAADTLSRVIREHGRKIVSLDEGKTYQSAGVCAQQQIAQWPAAGREAYRVLFDGEAQRLMDKALAAHDTEPLWGIIREFPHTTQGPRAIELLTAWLLDLGRPGEASDALDRLSIYSDERLPKWRALELRAMVQAALRLPAAEKTVMELMNMTSSVKGLPPDWPERLDAIERYRSEMLAATATGVSIPFEPWSTPLGPASAHGHAPAVTPVITPQMPWSDRLPGIDRVDEAAALRIIDATARVPVWRAATDGRLLFYTGQTGLVARDLSTFDFVWQSVPISIGSDRRITDNRGALGFFNNGVQQDNEQRLDPHTTRALFQEYAGLTTCAHGLVFQIEQAMDPSEGLPTREGDAQPLPLTEGSVMPNSIRAFKADSGLSAWTLGRSGPVQDELRDAHFYSTPIAAGLNLIAPYERGHDYFLAVISPEGAILQKIHLGTGHSLMFPINSVLTPLVADGTIYVPTGAGTLAALSEADYSLRWLTRYDRVEGRSSRSARRQQQRFMMGRGMLTPQPDEWIASPPIVVGQLVLLAPQDSDKLLAFDRSSGVIRWKAPRRRHRYVVGADETRIIVAGKEVDAIRLADGEVEWEFNSANGKTTGVIPSGRPLLAGDQVLVPTDSGLLTLNAATGQAIGEMLPYEEPLGNLMVAEGALYSLSATSVVKFPDVVWTRARAQERLAANPADLDAAIRLAWLAALEKKWDEVLKRLDAAAPDTANAGSAQDGLLDRAAHLRVTALLRLAEDMDASAASQTLENAAAASRQPSDAVDVGLALMDRMAEAGDAAGALTKGVELLMQAGDEAVHIESGLNGRASILIGERLKRTAGAPSSEELRAAASKIVSDAIERASTPAAKSLLADGLGFREEAARLDIEAARAAQTAGNFETAVYYMSRAARRARSAAPPSAALAAEALARWASLLVEPGPDIPSSPGAAAALVDELESISGDVVLPPDLAAPGGMGGFIQKLRASVAATAGPTSFKPTPRLRVLAANIEGSWFPERSFDFREAAGSPAVDVLPVRQNRSIMGISLRDSGRVRAGRVAWNSGAAPVADPSDLGSRLESPAAVTGRTRSAARSHQVAILDTGPTFQAVGLWTGRCIWRPLAIDRSRGDPPHPSVAAVNGMAIVAPDAATLVALPARDGAEPLWTRDFGRTRLGRLAAVGDNLIAIDRDATWVFVIDPESGRIARQYALAALAPLASNLGGATDEAPPVNTVVAITGGVICRSEGKRVMARDVQSGRDLWDKAMPARIRGLQILDDAHIAISYRGDKLAVVRAESGEVVKDLTIDDLELPASEIALEGRKDGAAGRLVLFAKTDDDPPKYKVACYPLDGSEPSFQGPWNNAMVTRGMLTGSPDHVAVIRYDRRDVDPQDLNVRIQQRGGQVQIINNSDRNAGLWIYDKNQGLRRVARHEFSGQDSPGRNIYGARSAEITDVVFAGPNVIAFGPAGICVLGPVEAGEPPAAESKGMDRP